MKSNEAALQNIIVASKRGVINLTMRSANEIIRAVGTVTQDQQKQIASLAERTESAPGDLLRLARECAQNGALMDVAQLDRFAAGEMIEVLEAYERMERAA